MDLTHIRILDHHAHNLLTPEAMAGFTLTAAFTEGYAQEIVSQHVRETLFFKRSLRQLAEALDCAPTLEGLLDAREQLGYEQIAQTLFDAGGFAALLLDDGFMPDRIMPTAWHNRFAPTYRFIRIEHLAAQLIAQHARWPMFAEAFRAALEARGSDVVGFKSIIAYRTGLGIAPPEEDAAQQCFGELRAQAERGLPVRIAHPPLNHWLVWTMMIIAARDGVPVQFHTGFGDPDLDLRMANPLHLRPLFEHAPFRGAPVVLLHASYPFTREAGYLAAVYPNAYLDLGLALPYLSRAGMRFAVRAALELAPLSKIMFSTDAHLIPETFYLGARCGREIIADVLSQTIADGDLSAAEADAAALDILHRNAARLYFGQEHIGPA
ncbi:MAG: amidohydrolase [Chloroflexi bacterium]|jgi:predicted TIM-barrel fold metal-dependent hydrolase|uniref:Amidohydrolase n=1 Tax=Candidatus Thermofonsia Clade 3 bacterium TaxID=2364212 RepID=A0A2M8QA16_9CHLR|nr:amidohydrolase family protein [Candidatus Roseilinea sp. NK_OTU-006]PJF46639.1 MAG: amidohydrolase [Candidatus Thermofonsia Clade 3 bacterium]RMG66207.1 MAG: amidohydrolase [Chloroflexota bacterium]